MAAVTTNSTAITKPLIRAEPISLDDDVFACRLFATISILHRTISERPHPRDRRCRRMSELRVGQPLFFYGSLVAEEAVVHRFQRLAVSRDLNARRRLHRSFRNIGNN